MPKSRRGESRAGGNGLVVRVESFWREVVSAGERSSSPSRSWMLASWILYTCLAMVRVRVAVTGRVCGDRS